MLQFRSLGGSTVKCTNKHRSLLVFLGAEGKGKGEKEKGIGERRKEGEYVLLSIPQEETDSETISWPGEYDFAELSIKGIGQREGEQVSYVVTAEGLRAGFLSSPLQEWSEREIELLGDLDVLVVPADNAKLVQKIVEEVDPPVVIPVMTKDEKTFKEILSTFGAKEVEKVVEVKLKKSSLPAESREVYVLEG